jgi:hypothetical protein
MSSRRPALGGSIEDVMRNFLPGAFSEEVM